VRPESSTSGSTIWGVAAREQRQVEHVAIGRSGREVLASEPLRQPAAPVVANAENVPFTLSPAAQDDQYHSRDPVIKSR
jgi:hypothetical protein